MLSSKPKVRMNPYRPLYAVLSCLALSACATQPQPVTINLPQVFRQACDRADVGPLATVGDLGSLVIRQEAALSVCDSRREAVVAIIDGYTVATKPRHRWPWSR